MGRVKEHQGWGRRLNARPACEAYIRWHGPRGVGGKLESLPHGGGARGVDDRLESRTCGGTTRVALWGEFLRARESR